jgi:hypothetical protein
MPLFALRLRDGNCLMIVGKSEDEAMNQATNFRSDGAVVSCREVTAFAAEFTLNDEGDLKSVLQDRATLAELRTNEYPMLGAAMNQSYVDFDASATDSRTDPVLFDTAARQHLASWDQRDKSLIIYSVRQERLRFSN